MTFSSDASLAQALLEYNANFMRNQIIVWKKTQAPSKADDFHRFLFEQFPENISVELRESFCPGMDDLMDISSSDSDWESDWESEEEECAVCKRFSAHTVKWVDQRVQGEEWRDIFFTVSITDEEVKLGCPPGMAEDIEVNSSDNLTAATNSLTIAVGQDFNEIGQKITSFFSKSNSFWGSLETVISKQDFEKEEACTQIGAPGLLQAC